MDSPSTLSVIRKAAVFSRGRPTFFLVGQRQPRGGGGRIHDLIALTKLLKLQRSGQFPDEPVNLYIKRNTFLGGVIFGSVKKKVGLRRYMS